MKLLYLALAMLFATSSDVFAQDAFSTVVGKGKTLFSSVRTVWSVWLSARFSVPLNGNGSLLWRSVC